MKITIIIVVYKTSPEHATTVRTLRNVLENIKGSLDNLSLIIYDNSPLEQNPEFLKSIYIDAEYIHDGRNLGISTAYNYAWSAAKSKNSEWLLLLDHDTEITNEYFNQVINFNKLDPLIVAVIPKIYSANKMISPVFSKSLRPLTIEKPQEGLQEESIMAINSGALISVEFLNEIGGFNQSFPLDYLDHWLFYEIDSRGRKVWLLESVLEHELSVMDFNSVSFTRYQSILDSEVIFYKHYKKDLFHSYRKQLAKRFFKQVLTVKNKKIAMYTLKRLFSM